LRKNQLIENDVLLFIVKMTTESMKSHIKIQQYAPLLLRWPTVLCIRRVCLPLKLINK